jgi:hypothetical protein
MVMARCFDNFFGLGIFDYRDFFYSAASMTVRRVYLSFQLLPFLASCITNRQLTLSHFFLLDHSSQTSSPSNHTLTGGCAGTGDQGCLGEEGCAS